MSTTHPDGQFTPNETRNLVLSTIKILNVQLGKLVNDLEIQETQIDTEMITLISTLLVRLNSQLRSLADQKVQTRASTYTMFPLKDDVSWQFYCTQECSLWSAKELDFVKDKEDFATLSPRYKELLYDIFGFFVPGDGMVSKAILRYLNDSETYEEQMFFIIQLFDELVHAESYGMTIISIIPDQETQQMIFGMMDDLPCIKAKGDYIEKYIESDLSKGLRFVAGAVAEGIFFVTLFAIIYYFRSKGKMKNFIFMNEQISKDETLHRDYNCLKAKQYLQPEEFDRALQMVKEGVEIELGNLQYILRTPVESAEADAIAGLTVENLSDYARMLADQVLVLIGLQAFYKVNVSIPFLGDISLGRKTNFYDGLVGSYKKFTLSTALDWKKRAGLVKERENVVSRPQDVDF
jgi:ribonucleotide reductase beta subunit family protein with ferritin-like domain